MPPGFRNLLIVVASVAALLLLPTWQALFLLLTAGLLYIIVVFFVQNLHLFRNVKAGELLRILGRTLLLWSPILLFYLPQYFLSRELNKLGTETAYDSGLVEEHDITPETTLLNLDRRLTVSPESAPPDFEPRPHLRDALHYATAELSDPPDVVAVLERFEYAFRSLEPGLELSPEAQSAMEAVLVDLDLAVRRRSLVGKNKFQLDTELTLQDVFRDREEGLTLVLDSLDRTVTTEVQATLDSINRNLSSTSASAKEDLQAARRTIEQRTDAQLDEIEKATIRGYERAFPPSLLQVSKRFMGNDCGIPGISCRALNVMKSLLRGVYAEQREAGLKSLRHTAAQRKERTRQKIRAQLDEAERAAFARIDRGEDGVSAYKDSLLVISRTTTEAVTETKGGMRELRLALNQGVRNGMWSLQRYLRYLRLTSLAVFVFLCITSFFYVFSRVAFARGTDLFVTLRRRREKQGKTTKPKAHGTDYTIPAGFPEVFYVSKKFVPTGRAPKLAVPQPLVSTVRRLVTGTLFMNEIAVRPNHPEPVDFRSTAGAEFVEWTIGEGEEVVFTYDHLVAFSGGVKLSSHLSLRLTTLLLGRPFFYLARGPGRLVLITKGTPLLTGKKQATRSVSAGRVVAWQRPVEFSVQSETNLVDIYFSSLYLQRSSPEYVLIDADDGRTRHKTGLFRFVLRFLLPI